MSLLYVFRYPSGVHTHTHTHTDIRKEGTRWAQEEWPWSSRSGSSISLSPMPGWVHVWTSGSMEFDKLERFQEGCSDSMNFLIMRYPLGSGSDLQSSFLLFNQIGWISINGTPYFPNCKKTLLQVWGISATFAPEEAMSQLPKSHKIVRERIHVENFMIENEFY